jgi:ankyrin repeat protein
VRLLAEKGAVVDAAGKDGLTALYRAAGSGHELVVRLLVEKGAMVDATDETVTIDM